MSTYLYPDTPIEPLNRTATMEDFIKDFEERIALAYLSIRGSIATIYLDAYPDIETRIILKLVKIRYSELLERIPSEDDIIKFKIK